jgi:hypothetical protein
MLSQLLNATLAINFVVDTDDGLFIRRDVCTLLSAQYVLKIVGHRRSGLGLFGVLALIYGWLCTYQVIVMIYFIHLL